MKILKTKLVQLCFRGNKTYAVASTLLYILHTYVGPTEKFGAIFCFS